MSSITPLNTKSHTFSSTTTTSSSSSSPACSPTSTTSFSSSPSSSSSDGHTQKFLDKTLDKVKSFVPQHQHQHHHQSKKSLPQPPTYVPQQHYQRRSTESLRGVQRRPTVTMYGRHSNEWLFGGVSVRRVVSELFQHDN